jgi:catechol O-methyltransferase
MGNKLKVKRPEERMLEYVLANAKKGDPDSVLETIDKFWWDENKLMYMGPEKGAILDEAVRNTKPMKALELGSYCGYTSLRIARLLPQHSRFISLDTQKMSRNYREPLNKHTMN